MDDKYSKLHSLSLSNEEIIRDKKCVCIYCKKEMDYKEIVDYIPDSDGLTAVCPFCGMDSVIPKEYDGYIVTLEDIEKLNEEYF